MKRTHWISVLTALLCAGWWSGASAGGEALADVPAVTGSKPSAPVSLRWIRDGREAVVEVEVSAGVDHDGVDLTLMLPGAGPVPARSLPAAGAGPAGTVSWELEAPVTTPPRVIVVLRQGAARQGASFVAPVGARQDVVRPDGQPDAGPANAKRSRAAGEARLPRPPAEAPEPPAPRGESAEPEALHPLPARETLRRGEPGGSDEDR
jgi:hypothetical protein